MNIISKKFYLLSIEPRLTKVHGGKDSLPSLFLYSLD